MKCRLASLIDQHNLRVSETKGRPERLTQRKLVKDTGIAGSTINRLYKNEFNRIDTNTINRLCDYFDCEIEDLFVLKETTP